MKSRILVIGNEFLTTGMKLAGIRNVVTTDKDHFQDEVKKAIDDETCGILILPESMYNMLDWRVRNRLETGVKPVVIQIPEPGTESKEGERIRALIKRAIGFDVMAKK